MHLRFEIKTAEQERKYNEVAQRVTKKEQIELGSTLQLLRSIYPDDAAFRAAFAETSIRTTDSRNNRVVRFILCAIERHLSQQAREFDSDIFNIEHVLPQNAPDNWGGIGNNDAEALACRLGNMTLLYSGADRDLGRANFAKKRAVYQQSGFAVTRKIGNENSEWTPTQIAAHQKWMARQAITIWRIVQLS